MRGAAGASRTLEATGAQFPGVPLPLARRRHLHIIISNVLPSAALFPDRALEGSEQVVAVELSVGQNLRTADSKAFRISLLRSSTIFKEVDLERKAIVYIPQKSIRGKKRKALESLILPSLENWFSHSARKKTADAPLFPSLFGLRTGGCNGLSARFRKLMTAAGVEKGGDVNAMLRRQCGGLAWLAAAGNVPFVKCSTAKRPRIIGPAIIHTDKCEDGRLPGTIRVTGLGPQQQSRPPRLFQESAGHLTPSLRAIGQP